MRVGAYDYILKDDLCDELVLPVLRAIGSRRQLEREVRELRARQAPGGPIAPGLVGTSRPMELLREFGGRRLDRPVLVTGPPVRAGAASPPSTRTGRIRSRS